jgi:hypothetical protein
MSLLREQSANFLASSNETVSSVATTESLQFVAPSDSAEAGQTAFAMSAGQYGEIQLEGDYLVGGPGAYLYLTINDQHFKVALEAWTPPA